MLADTYKTSIVRVILAASDELIGASGIGVDARLLQNFLRGNRLPASFRRADDDDREFSDLLGILAGYEASWLQEVVTGLIDSGELELVEGSARTLRVSPSGRAVLAKKEHPWLNVFPRPPRLGTHPALEQELWEMRRRHALREGRAAYSIFPNAVLAAIAAKRPASLGELAGIRGMGEARVRKYGRTILRAIARATEKRKGKSGA